MLLMSRPSTSGFINIFLRPIAPLLLARLPAATLSAPRQATAARDNAPITQLAWRAISIVCDFDPGVSSDTTHELTTQLVRTLVARKNRCFQPAAFQFLKKYLLHLCPKALVRLNKEFYRSANSIVCVAATSFPL